MVNRNYQHTKCENVLLTDSLMLYCTFHSMSTWLQILKLDVDSQKKKISALPYCRLAIIWEGERPRNTFPFVSRQVNLKGTNNPFDYFIIKLPGRGKILVGESFELSLVPFSKTSRLTGNHATLLVMTLLSDCLLSPTIQYLENIHDLDFELQ